MIGNVAPAPALLHQLVQRQRSPPPERLGVDRRRRQGHLHPGKGKKEKEKKRSALAPHERDDRRLEDSQGERDIGKYAGKAVKFKF